MRLWLRRKIRKDGKRYGLHEWNGTETTCLAITCQGLNVDNYYVTGKVHEGEHVCLTCQTAIAQRRGRL